MTIGPEPRTRILWRSSRLGMEGHLRGASSPAVGWGRRASSPPKLAMNSSNRPRGSFGPRPARGGGGGRRGDQPAETGDELVEQAEGVVRPRAGLRVVLDAARRDVERPDALH